jgi:pimeloyl-ACP methyl ester carboxylesterase
VTGPTIVLVHGGGFDSRCWDLTIPHLEHPVLAVDLPGRGSRPEPLESVTFPRCGQAIVEEVDAAGAREVVLVGHSLGGSSIIPAVGRLGDRVRHVVCVAAMVPRHGYGTHQEWTEDLRASIDDERHRGRDTMSPDKVAELFGNDLDEEGLAWCVARLVPEAEGLTTEPVDLTPLRSGIPTSWVLTTRDAIMKPAMQRRFIGNVGEGCEVVELDAGHMCMISQPEALAEILDGIAARS